MKTLSLERSLEKQNTLIENMITTLARHEERQRSLQEEELRSRMKEMELALRLADMEVKLKQTEQAARLSEKKSRSTDSPRIKAKKGLKGAVTGLLLAKIMEKSDVRESDSEPSQSPPIRGRQIRQSTQVNPYPTSQQQYEPIFQYPDPNAHPGYNPYGFPQYQYPPHSYDTAYQHPQYPQYPQYQPQYPQRQLYPPEEERKATLKRPTKSPSQVNQSPRSGYVDENQTTEPSKIPKLKFYDDYQDYEEEEEGQRSKSKKTTKVSLIDLDFEEGESIRQAPKRKSKKKTVKINVEEKTPTSKEAKEKKK